MSRRGTTAVLALFGLLGSVVVSEFVLRSLGREAKHFGSDEQFNESDTFAPDPVLGWANKPGTHHSFEPGHRAFTVTPDGIRRSSSPKSTYQQEILVVGGSFAHGYGVEDHETFADVLSAWYPHIAVSNIATPGYGTVQSFLSMRQFLANPENRQEPVLVIYGFIGHHIWRNVASYEWIRSVISRSGHYRAPPYVRYAGDTLEFREGGRVEAWPLESSSALVSILHDAYLMARHNTSMEKAVEATVKLLAETAAVAIEDGSTLLVVLLAESQPEVESGLRDRGVNVLNCEHPKYGVDRKLKNGNHPSAGLHAYWAACIRDWFEANRPDRD